MNNTDRITILERENIIWFIYLFFVIFGIKANNLEIEDIKNNNQNNKNTYKSINIIILLISVFIYLYFINLTTKYIKQKKNRSTILLFVGSILFFIAGLCFLLSELIDDNNIIPNEL